MNNQNNEKLEKTDENLINDETILQLAGEIDAINIQK